jgi:carnitine 3-dehydrogenase
MRDGKRVVGLLGGGVIGGGWAARFALNGWDINLYDPDPEAKRKVDEMLTNARAAYVNLVRVSLPQEGKVTVVSNIEAMTENVDFIQESAPERLELKQSLLLETDRYAASNVVIGSSTSGLLPSKLQAEMNHPERLVVGHPFNPVYLLPLVEIVPGIQSSSWAIESAAQTYTSLGMKPLVLKKEVDGFVADRLLEALWREALWLVNDGVATMTEIDDAIRFGAGLRWSFMGTMLTYRIAGGEGGMRHFMSQFGPALQWPWTRLMDVPELTEDFLDRLQTQSDEQANGTGVRDLEALRDACLVSVMHGLANQNYASGEVLNKYEEYLKSNSHI